MELQCKTCFRQQIQSFRSVCVCIRTWGLTSSPSPPLSTCLAVWTSEMVLMEKGASVLNMFLTADSEIRIRRCVYTHRRINKSRRKKKEGRKRRRKKEREEKKERRRNKKRESPSLLLPSLSLLLPSHLSYSYQSLLLLNLLLILLSTLLSSSSWGRPQLLALLPPCPSFGSCRHWWEGAPTHYHLEGKSERQRPMRWETRHYHDSEDTSCFSTVGSVRGTPIRMIAAAF